MGSEEGVSKLNWIDIIFKVGVPSTIAVFLVYMLTTNISNDITNIKSQVALHSVDMSNQMKMQERMERLLQQICANTATNNKERAYCFIVGNGQ